MSIRVNKYPIINFIKPQNILVSVFDKSGLDKLVAGILEVNPQVRFYSTGGTGKEILRILDGLPNAKSKDNYISVEDFTKAPEMEGGLVKTLHPKIHGGLLAERGNPAHEEYLYKTMAEMTGTAGVYFDIYVGNLYPFESVIAKEDSTPEDARINIDIGGPAMTMAAAKNWHSVTTLISPQLYGHFMGKLNVNSGKVSLEDRFYWASYAMMTIGKYRSAIGYYFRGSVKFEEAVLGLTIQKE